MHHICDEIKLCLREQTENLTNETAGLHLINSYQVTATYKEFWLKFGGSVRNGVITIH